MKPGALREILASLVVFLVALPLCMGVAIASGAPPAMGLVSGIIGGIVVGLLAGSPLQVSGPAAGLAVIVYDAIQAHGLERFWAVVLIAGVLQIVAARLSLGRWFRAVAPAVIYGMLAGIGVLIFASQFHVMLGATPATSGLANLAAIPGAIWSVFAPAPGEAFGHAALVATVALACLIGWNRLRTATSSRWRVVPAALVAVVVATLVAHALAAPVAFVTVPEAVGDLFALPATSTLSALWDPAVIGSGVALAAIASAEALLCASAVDRLHDGPPSEMNRELFAQGVGNTVCGVIGGLPVTGVIVRSTANVEAGGRTRWSAVLHGVWLISLIALAPMVLRWIPIAALAAVLVYIGVKLVNPATIRDLAARGRAELAIYVTTVAAITTFGLLIGLAVGVAVTLLRLAWEFSHLDVQIDARDDGVIEVDLRGAATFISLPVLTEALQGLPAEAPIKLHLDHLQYADHACLEYIGEWERRRIDVGGTLEIAWDVLKERARPPRLREASAPPKAA